jgi:hypothetical protein
MTDTLVSKYHFIYCGLRSTQIYYYISLTLIGINQSLAPLIYRFSNSYTTSRSDLFLHFFLKHPGASNLNWWVN